MSWHHQNVRRHAHSIKREQSCVMFWGKCKQCQLCTVKSAELFTRFMVAAMRLVVPTLPKRHQVKKNSSVPLPPAARIGSVLPWEIMRICTQTLSHIRKKEPALIWNRSVFFPRIAKVSVVHVFTWRYFQDVLFAVIIWTWKLCFVFHRKGIKHKMCCGHGEEPDRPPSCLG